MQPPYSTWAILGSLVWLAVAHLVPNLQAADLIRPGEIWRDTDGQPIQAHSAGILYHQGLFYASEDNATLYVSRLDSDFTDVERPAVEGKTWRRNFPGGFREAPAPFKHAGRYYLISSGCTGWNPNAADLAIADHPLGPYVSQGNPCAGPNADKTFGAQSTFVLPLPNQPGHFVFLTDQ